MKIRTTIIDKLPEAAERSARLSICQDVVDLAVRESPRVVQVDGESTEDITRFYKSMIQYKARHEKDLDLGIRKVGDVLYVWVRPAKDGPR